MVLEFGLYRTRGMIVGGQMHHATSQHTGKPVCSVHLDQQFRNRCGEVTAAKQAPKGTLKLTGLPVPGAPGYRPGPIEAKAARKVAEAQPGGAIIVWQDDKHEYAHVYSRVRFS